MIINVKTTRQGDEHNTFLEDFEGFVDGAGTPVSMPFTDNDTKHRHYHVGLAELVAVAPLVTSYDDLPENGVIVTVSMGVVTNLFTYTKLGDDKLYEWLFDEDHTDDDVHLLHTGDLEVSA